MTTTTTLATAPAQIPEQSVVAGVNEKKLFSTMKHLFATSFSLVGELMQNARRSGATQILFNFDPEAKTLEVIDDGCGISDFGKLLALCDSGWDEKVTLADSPYGMGLFSLHFACSRATFRSNGLKLQTSLDDIVNKRQLVAVIDNDPVRLGTVLQLEGLTKDLLGKSIGPHFGRSTANASSRMEACIIELAMGFPIDVQFNGVSVPRPHALENLQTVLTPVGQVHIAHIMARDHDQNVRGDELDVVAGRALYLQGLPIQVKNEIYAQTVVHLDSQRFAAIMPDRKALYNAADQLEELRVTLRTLVQQFLVEQKASLPTETFVAKYWTACLRHDVPTLLNDIPLLPRQIISTIETLAADSESRLGYLPRETEFISWKQILNGEFKVWRDVPSYLGNSEGEQAGALWRVMQLENVVEVDTSGLDKGHWIFEATPSAADFKVAITHSGIIASDSTYFDDNGVDVCLVKSAQVLVTSTTDPSFEIATAVDRGWILEEVGHDSSGEVTQFNCFVTESGSSWDFPGTLLSSYRDEHEVYREEWEDDARKSWRSVVAGLKGASLADQLAAALPDVRMSLGNHNLGQMALIYGAADGSDPTVQNVSPQMEIVDLNAPEFWLALANLLATAAGGSPEDLKMAFLTAAGSLVPGAGLTAGSSTETRIQGSTS